MELTFFEGSVVATLGLLLALAAVAPAWWMKTVLGRRLKEEKLEHSDAVARIESSAADPMLTIDETGLIRSFNKSAESVFGYTGQEIINRSIGTLIPAAANGAGSGYGLNSLNAARKTPNGIGVEVMGLRKNGTSMPLDLRLTAATEGGVRLFHAVMRDLSDRIAAEKNARDVQFFDGLLQSVGAPVIVLDKEGKVARHNRAFTEWSGHVDPEGRQYWELLLPADDWSRAKVAVAQVIAGGSPEKGEQIWRKRNGDTVPMLLAITALRAGNAPAEAAVVVGFEAPARQAGGTTPDAAMDAVERLAGGIARQFNDLLTSINGYSELVLHGMAAQDPLRHDVEQIQKAGERATALTSQLLAFSRKQPMKPSVFSLNTLIGGMKQTLEVLLGDRIQVSTILDLELGHLKADASWIEQVILNLAVNARDAMPDGGKLTLETANIELDAASARKTAQLPAGEYVILSVTDTGTGIDPAIRQHLFQPFTTTKRAGKGLGLGLSTVYGVVKQSGGNVVVQSFPGNGTSVRIFLPRYTAGELPEKSAKGLFLVRGAGQ